MFNHDEANDSIVINEEILSKLNDDMLNIVMSSIKDRMVKEVISSLDPRNLYGEASEYLRGHSIPEDDTVLAQYAEKALSELKENIDYLIRIDSTTNKIVINQCIAEFEFGSLYKPILKIITKTVELSLQDK